VNAAAPHTAHRALPRGARRQPQWRRRRRGRVATRPRGDAQRCGAQRAKPVKHSPLTLVFKLRDIYEVECVNERSELCRTDRVIAGQTRVKLETSMYVAATNANSTIAFVVYHLHQNLPYHSRCTINYRALTDTYCKGCVFSEPAFSAQLTPPELCLMRNAHARSGLFAFVWFRVSACSFKIHPGISRCSPLEAVRGGGLECARRGGGLLSRLGLSSVDEISRRRGTFGGSRSLPRSTTLLHRQAREDAAHLCINGLRGGAPGARAG